MHRKMKRSAGAALAAAALLALPGAATDIESGQWYTGTISTNAPARVYQFQADSNDTVILRVANEDALLLDIPDLSVFYDDRASGSLVPVTGWTARYGSHEVSVPVTNFGWYYTYCSLPASLATYSNELAYSVSMLRMPDAPLSLADPDVGPIQNGPSLEGVIDVGADLDAASFPVSRRCTVQVRMGQVSVPLVPSVQLYDPAGMPVTNDYPPEYRAEITATLDTPGIYTLGLNDYFEGRGRYAVSFVRMGEAPSGADPDIGPIISGETKSGLIHVPGDLDLAVFDGLTGDQVAIRMGEASAADIALNPVIELFGPDGVRLARGTDVFQIEAALTNVLLTSNGVHSIVCKDAQDRSGVRYTLRMEFLPGSPSLLLNKPLPPTGLSASDGTFADHILLNWSASASPTVSGYDLWRSEDGLAFVQLTTNRPSTAYQDFGVASNRIYYYRVAARNAHAVSEFSNTNSGYRGSVLPAPVSALQASDGLFPNTILVQWQASPMTNVTGYDLWRKTWTNAYQRIAANWYSLAFSDTSAQPNLVYTYRVQARNAFGVSDFSPEDTGYCGSTNALGVRRALLVGIDRYAYGPSDLTTCTNDAAGVRRHVLLEDPAARWQASRMVMLTDAQATRDAIRSNLFAMAGASGAGDLALYYHSGHGGQSPGANPSNTYLCAHDADYTDAQLAADLALFRPEATVIVILDACFSGGMYKEGGGAPSEAWPFAERVMAHYRRLQAERYAALGLDVPQDLGANIAFMTSSDYDELSWTSDVYSLYTRFLIKGCTLAFVNTNQDSDYSFMELHAYAAEEARRSRATQNGQALHPALLAATPARGVDPGAAVLHYVAHDADGDGASDLVVFHPGSGLWRIVSLKRWQILAWDDFTWGGPGFRAYDGDYDGDGASDLAVYSERAAEWRIASFKRRTVLLPTWRFGGLSLNPVQGDFNGDGRSDAALYQQPDGFWYIVASTGVPLLWGESFTGRGFLPVSGDFDGDGVSDLALYHPSTGTWYIGSLVRGAFVRGQLWGGPAFQPLSGDFDADGHSDLALYQPESGAWHVYSLRREAVIVNGLVLGGPAFLPVPGDYDGDGRYDLAVYEQATGFWHFRTADGGEPFALLYPVGGPGWQAVQ